MVGVGARFERRVTTSQWRAAADATAAEPTEDETLDSLGRRRAAHASETRNLRVGGPNRRNSYRHWRLGSSVSLGPRAVSSPPPWAGTPANGTTAAERGCWRPSNQNGDWWQSSMCTIQAPHRSEFRTPEYFDRDSLHELIRYNNNTP